MEGRGAETRLHLWQLFPRRLRNVPQPERKEARPYGSHGQQSTRSCRPITASVKLTSSNSDFRRGRMRQVGTALQEAASAGSRPELDCRIHGEAAAHVHPL